MQQLCVVRLFPHRPGHGVYTEATPSIGYRAARGAETEEAGGRIQNPWREESNV